MLPGITRDNRFDERCRELFGDLQIADERVAAVEWAIRRCESLDHFPILKRLPNGATLRYAKTDPAKWSASIVVIFTASADRENIVFHDIAAFETDDNDL